MLLYRSPQENHAEPCCEEAVKGEGGGGYRLGLQIWLIFCKQLPKFWQCLGALFSNHLWRKSKMVNQYNCYGIGFYKDMKVTAIYFPELFWAAFSYSNFLPFEALYFAKSMHFETQNKIACKPNQKFDIAQNMFKGCILTLVFCAISPWSGILYIPNTNHSNSLEKREMSILKILTATLFSNEFSTK